MEDIVSPCKKCKKHKDFFPKCLKSCKKIKKMQNQELRMLGYRYGGSQTSDGDEIYL